MFGFHSAVLLGLGLTAALAGAQDPAARTFERLNGFDTVLVTEINRVMGTERLPAANGYPVEPGMYVTIGSSQITIFDRVATALNAGMPADRTASPDCASGCPSVLYDAFRRAWMELHDEQRMMSIDVPSRVLFGVDAQLPARALVDAAYAASEARPGAPPALYMVFNGGPAGVRARPFYLLPPKGLQTPVGSTQLSLRVKVLGGDRYEIRSSGGAMAPVTVTDRGKLKGVLLDVGKRFPSKSVIFIDVTEEAYVYDVVSVMVAAQDQFTSPVLGLGQRIGVG